MNPLASLFAKNADTKDVDRVTSQVKLANALGQTLVVVATICLATYKLAKELKKD